MRAGAATANEFDRVCAVNPGKTAASSATSRKSHYASAAREDWGSGRRFVLTSPTDKPPQSA
jgi:hypothetical protein